MASSDDELAGIVGTFPGAVAAYPSGSRALHDIGNHIVAESALGTRDDAVGFVDCPARAGAIPPDLFSRVRGLAGFRNILVLDYLAVDQRPVHALLQRLDDLADLGRVLGEWVRTHCG